MKKGSHPFWYIVQKSRGEAILKVNGYAEAVEAAEKLSALWEKWNMTPDAVHHMKMHYRHKYEEFLSIEADYHIDEDINKNYLETLNSQDIVRYLSRDYQGELQEVEGFHIVKGLAVHQNDNGSVSLIHVPSGKCIMKAENLESGCELARTISNVTDWSSPSAYIKVKRSHTLQNDLIKAKGGRIPSGVSNQPPSINKTNERDTSKNTSPNSFGRHRESGKPVSISNENTHLDDAVAKELEQFKRMFDNHPKIHSRYPDFEQAYLALNDMVGLGNVKNEIKRKVRSIRGKLINQGKVQSKATRLHKFFVGDPGTGKTEVARLMGQLYYSLGLLPTKSFKEVSRPDLVSSNVGGTGELTQSVIHGAMDGVLFIDEAYSLAQDDSGNDFGKEALDTLITYMTNHPDRLVVIMAGYEDKMKDLFKLNDGLESRVEIIKFDEYNLEELLEIAHRMIKNNGYQISDEATSSLERFIASKCKGSKLNGNARAIDNIVVQVIEELNIRIGEEPVGNTLLIVEEDIEKVRKGKNYDVDRMGLEEIKQAALEKLQLLKGMGDLKEEVQNMLQTIPVQKAKFEQGLLSEKPRMHMAFMGPPGTGKTTVARIIGEFLKGSGILSSGHFIEVTRSDLVGKYQGDSAINTKNLVEKAIGGVLFIDEAYGLYNGEHDSFGLEVIIELIALMETHKDDLVVILAGYEEDIKKLYQVNPGFTSRIGKHFTFQSYDTEAIVDITKLELQKNSMVLDEEAEKALGKVIHQYAEQHEGHFEGNGRWCSNFSHRIIDAQMVRISPLIFNEDTTSQNVLTSIKESDIQNASKGL